MQHYPSSTRLELLNTPTNEIQRMIQSVIRKNFEAYYPQVLIQREIMSFKMGFSKNAKMPDFMDLFPAWANPDLIEPKKPIYSKGLISSFNHALKKGVVSNQLLSALNVNKLRQSGWNPERKTMIPDANHETSKKRKKGG